VVGNRANAHRYFDTSHAILQATVDHDIPDLELAVAALIDDLEADGSTQGSVIFGRAKDRARLTLVDTAKRARSF